MYIVSGYLIIVAGRRDEYLSRCADIVIAARSAPGCLDFALSADLVESDRVNVFECWQDVESLDRFRESGPDDELIELIIRGDTWQHEVATSINI
jgi:quinol monooxygenase YgiN